MNTHLMIDMETLGNRPDTAVLSLGAVIFNREQIIRKNYWEFDLNEQLKVKRSVSADTLAWWFKQNQEASSLITRCSNSRVSAKVVAEEFKGFIGNSRCKVWSNGAGFDVPIMENILSQCGFQPPWAFWDIRCYRTMKAMFHIEKGKTNEGLKHHAGDDAEYQTKCLITYLQNNPLADA